MSSPRRTSRPAGPATSASPAGPNLCLERRSIGTHVDGAFAPRLVVPLANLHPVPDWLPDHAAALTEPLACVCNALFDPPVVAPGDEVLVLGPGAIGLLAAQAVRAAGGRVTVVGTERDAARLELAAKLVAAPRSERRPVRRQVLLQHKVSSTSSSSAPARRPGSRAGFRRRGAAGGSSRSGSAAPR